MNSNGAVVNATDVTRRYGEGEAAVDALRGVSLAVQPGELVAVMGPSGSGKSTLMHILAGLDKPTSGDVQVDGESITSMGDTELTKLRRRSIGFVFQFFNLLPMLNAEENVVLPLSIAGEKPDKQWLDELMAKTGLGDRRTHRPSELSGGQQQRVAIARALVSRPAIVFADEPTGNLDSKTSGEILKLMRDSVEELGQTTVMVTHEPRAAAIADRVLFLADGVIVEERKDMSASDVVSLDAVAGQLMLQVALKGLAGRKLRAFLTGFAIVLGVAMVSGTFVLTDTLKAGFGEIFTSVYKSSDAVVTGKSAIGNGNNGNIAPSMPESLLAKVQSLPDVSAAKGGVSDQAQLVGRDGKVISNGFAPGLAFSVDPNGTQQFNPLVLTSGTWPRGPHEIAIDKSTADKKHYTVGETIGAVARGPVQQYRITGVVKLGNVSSIGGATMAIFDLPTAQKIFGKVGQARCDRRCRAARRSRPRSSSRRSSPSCLPRHRCEAAPRRPRSRCRTRVRSRASCRSSCSRSEGSRSSSGSS